jgi:hypothetical protein
MSKSRYKLTLVSGNRKVGPMPIVACSSDTCWTGCPFRGDCYGKTWPLVLHWKRLDDGATGYSFEELIKRLNSMPYGTAWRWGDVGDLPGKGGNINATQLSALIDVNRRGRRRGFAYTHKPVLGTSRAAVRNRLLIADANHAGFCINASTEGLNKADAVAALDIAPVATVIPKHGVDTEWRKMHTPSGRLVARCPAEWQVDGGGSKMQCTRCGGAGGPLCSRPNRNFIVGFTAHGKVRKIGAVIDKMEAKYEQND